MKFHKCKSGSAQNWFCTKLVLREICSVKLVLSETGSTQAVPYEIGSMTRQMNEIKEVRKWFLAKLVLCEIGAAKVVLCEKGLKGNWFNDSIGE